MKVLVIGSNGREHAIAHTYAKSKKVKKIFIAPGNGLSDFFNKKIHNIAIEMTDFPKLLQLALKEKIDLVDVAQDETLALGYVDLFEKHGIPAFGPTQLASQIEWDKQWARNFMETYHLPIPRYKSFTHEKDALTYIDQQPEQLLFIKASGLALGKGVIKAQTKQEAKEAIQKMRYFGKSGETFLIEEGLIGEEFSLFAICDGNTYHIISVAQDHKTLYENDTGPNTGGMGSIAKAKVGSKKLILEVERTILQPFMKGMRLEKRPYSGILYIGGMVTKTGVKIIEFNARWGDPEAEVILPSIKNDYFDLITAVLKKELQKVTITVDKKIRLSIAACARGYPIDYSHVKGKEIFGIESVSKMRDITLFGSGIKRVGKKFFANGGRLFYIVAEGTNSIDARKKAYSAMSTIYIEGNNLHYRTDIGAKDVMRMYSKINQVNQN